MEKLLTPEEVAEMLDVKLSTIYKWTHLGFIPHIKLGRLLRFRNDDIMKWLQHKSQKGRKSKKIDISSLEIKI